MVLEVLVLARGRGEDGGAADRGFIGRSPQPTAAARRWRQSPPGRSSVHVATAIPTDASCRRDRRPGSSDRYRPRAQLLAAHRVGEAIRAVVTVGIPDEAEIAVLRQPVAPILLIGSGTSGDHESGVRTRQRLGGTLRLETTPGARTLGSGDPGPHKRAFGITADWFARHLRVQDPQEAVRRERDRRGTARRRSRTPPVSRSAPAPQPRRIRETSGIAAIGALADVAPILAGQAGTRVFAERPVSGRAQSAGAAA